MGTSRRGRQTAAGIEEPAAWLGRVGRGRGYALLVQQSVQSNLAEVPSVRRRAVDTKSRWAVDPENTVHDMAMTITGGLSKSERQHVQRRVRAAMAAQVLIDGRYQGGRPPYGYVVVDGGPHPHPRKAQEGHRLRCLAIDEFASTVVRRIFDL